ncbi:hypothetical protein RQP46_004103 [Phenoliferia psychrophenolica]
MAGSHIELRKRNAEFAKKAGTTTKLKVVDPLDKKRPLPAWALWTLLFVVLGGVFFEVLQQIVNALSSPVSPIKAAKK